MRLPWQRYICRSKYGCFCLSPQVTYLHTKNEGGLKFFISNFASLSWRIALKYEPEALPCKTPTPFPCFHPTPEYLRILHLFLKLVSLDVELMYLLWTSVMIIQLRCGQVIELRSAKEKTCTPNLRRYFRNFCVGVCAAGALEPLAYTRASSAEFSTLY